MPINKVGFFKALNSIFAGDEHLDTSGANYDINEMSSYLASGTNLIAAPGPAFDVFKKSQLTPIGARGVDTDGHWIWPSELIFYVKNYNVHLPNAFILHCKKNKWSIPKNIDIQRLTSELMQELQYK